MMPLYSNLYYPMDPRVDPRFHSTRGVGDVTLPGILFPPYGTYQYFRGELNERGGREHEVGGKSGIPSTLVVAAIVGVGVVGYFIYRNLLVSTSAVRGAAGVAREYSGSQ